MLGRLKRNAATADLARWARRTVKRGIYACGPVRRLSYKLRAPAEKEPALAGCKSLIHVGANEGQERYLYEFLDLEVLWVEPIPHVYSRLMRNIRGIRKQMGVQALLSDKPDQKLMLNISNNCGLSSSIFELAKHKVIWPDVHYVDRIECVTATLDSLLPLLPSPDALVLDTQGAELGARRGRAHASPGGPPEDRGC